MHFHSWKSLRRNWLVGILGLLVTLGLVAGAVILSPAKYVTTSQMVLLPPISQPNANYNGVVNPYMGLAGLQSMAAVVSSAMMDDETAQQLKAAGVSSYSVQYNSLSAGPILIVQATEHSPSQASHAITVLDQQVPVTVASLQKEASIAPRSFISAKVIARPTIPSKSTKTELRVVGLALIVGLVLTLLAVSVVDGWRTRRRQDFRSKNSRVRVASLLSASAETNGRAHTEPSRPSEKSATVTASLSFDNSNDHAPADESVPSTTHPSL
jgi:hypothetical protein